MIEGKLNATNKVTKIVFKNELKIRVSDQPRSLVGKAPEILY